MGWRAFLSSLPASPTPHRHRIAAPDPAAAPGRHSSEFPVMTGISPRQRNSCGEIERNIKGLRVNSRGTATGNLPHPKRELFPPNREFIRRTGNCPGGITSSRSARPPSHRRHLRSTSRRPADLPTSTLLSQQPLSATPFFRPHPDAPHMRRIWRFYRRPVPSPDQDTCWNYNLICGELPRTPTALERQDLLISATPRKGASPDGRGAIRLGGAPRLRPAPKGHAAKVP